MPIESGITVKQHGTSGDAMKWISAQWRSLATLVVCAAYVVFWFRNNLDSANTLMAVVISGVLALGSLFIPCSVPTFSIASPRFSRVAERSWRHSLPALFSIMLGANEGRFKT